MFRPEPGATLLYPSGPSHDQARNHLFILMTAPSGPADQILMVSVSTRQKRSDTTCVLAAGAHAFIRHESVVEYKFARIEPARRLVSGVASGEFIVKDPVTHEIFERVRAGLYRSPFAKPYAREFLKDYGS